MTVGVKGGRGCCLQVSNLPAFEGRSDLEIFGSTKRDVLFVSVARRRV